MQPTQTRPPAVSGMFYPEERAELAEHIDALLQGHKMYSGKPKAIIVPHAGTIYSGPVAATAYAQLVPYAETIEQVILFGPNHRVALGGFAFPTVGWFQTPLGRLTLAHQAIADIVGSNPLADYSDNAHAEEHCLEVQLPFLQRVLPSVDILPCIVGETADHHVAALMNELWGDENTLIVLSTDLSHFLDYDTAQLRDNETAAAIETLAGKRIGDQAACGRYPLAGLLCVARDRKMEIKRLGLKNSGDTAGPRDRVVGYGSWALYES